MERKLGYRHTIYACFVGYVVQAIVNNFAPLLFLTFHGEFGVSLDRIAVLVSVNFAVQLATDLVSSRYVDRIGYRRAMYLAHVLGALGLILLAVLPSIMEEPFYGLLAAVTVYAVGGGLLEVLVSPVVEACPTRNKASVMSLLHSFYCWGHMGVVILSTVFFVTVGIAHWRALALVWALVPLLNLFYFMNVPIPTLQAEDGEGLPIRSLLGMGMFWIVMLLMFCAGACEQSMSQWASTFAELALGVSKTMGDLFGPLLFALLMGLSRALYAKVGDRVDLTPFMAGSGVLCLLSYLMASLTRAPAWGLVGCGLCGLSVGILWPGTFSTASARIPRGGTALFALLALAGDLGCGGGPALVGLVSGAQGGDLKAGLLAAAAFPVLLLVGIGSLRRAGRRRGD